MEKNKDIYMVEYAYGQYEDYTEDIVAIFDSEFEAKRFVEKEQDNLKKLIELRDKCYYCKKNKPLCNKSNKGGDMCEYQIDSWDDFLDGTYRIEKHTLFSSLEEVRSIADKNTYGMSLNDRIK